MRVTALTTTMPRPRKPRLLGFVRALRLAGHEVAVVATTDLSQGGKSSGSDDAGGDLAALGVEVTTVPFDPGPLHLAAAAGSAVLRRHSAEVALYRSRSLAADVSRAVLDTRPDVLHVERARAFSLVRDLSIPMVVDVTDPRLAAYGHYRRAGRTRPLRVAVPELLRAALDRRPAAREEIAALRGVPVLVASEMGRRSMIEAGADGELVRPVLNVVFPEERAEPAPSPANGQVVLGMSGNLSYAPNVLGFEAFATEIVPAIRREISPRVVVVGASPRPAVLRRAERSGIEVHADVTSVPEALHELGVSVMLSPQTVSAGFPNRIVDAVYRAGIPVVASPQTLEGAPGELAAATPVAETGEEWLRETVSLLAEPRRRDMVVDLQARIEALCAPEAVAAALSSAYQGAALPR